MPVRAYTQESEDDAFLKNRLPLFEISFILDGTLCRSCCFQHVHRYKRKSLFRRFLKKLSSPEHRSIQEPFIFRPTLIDLPERDVGTQRSTVHIFQNIERRTARYQKKRRSVYIMNE